MSMATQAKKHHYWGVPMSSELLPLFSEFGEEHVLPDYTTETLSANSYPTDKWAIACDPGNLSAFVLVQLKSYPRPKMIVHKTWETESNEKLTDTCKRVKLETLDYLGVEMFRKIKYHADIAAAHKHGNNSDTYKQTMEMIFEKIVTTKKQPIAPGVNLLKLYMAEDRSFFVCRNNAVHLCRALKKAVPIVDEATGMQLDAYVKDGVHDHILDATRYLLSNETRGVIPGKQVKRTLPRNIRGVYS
jgi:hypothetical protein